MSAFIGVGILGFAHGHVHAYCDEWKNPELGIAVRAGWDHDSQRMEAACQQFGLQGYADADSLLERSDIQAVVIASETSRHAELVELAAARGKAIVLQKPLALTMAEADRIVNAVRDHQVPFTMAWQMRTDPQNIQMKQWIESGELGQIFMVRRRHGLPVGLNADFADTWHVDPAANRDIWADDSAHPVDFIHWLLGEPDSVTAEIGSLYNPRIPMDNGIAVYRYSGGPIAEVSCSFTCTSAVNTTEIIGELGTIVQNYGDATSCNVPRPDDGASAGLIKFTTATGTWTASGIVSPQNHGYRIRGLAKPLADFLRGESGPLATAEEGRTSLRMVLATYVSNEEGRRVQLSDLKIEQV
ncbi:Gfo/Idh/MocA family protein [Paenibacillus montanisoli]|uniref:Gfo/Idh/MocA family oxidoreductase n=1 Tax=Paenibacillus montanisoli TaxID=2081970 RepID=A0A328UBR1_9BACL|nr:Gfo/Idh/MocA family oxidoreductase [Paenibacillus montanisoli]RAP78345.1 gfo/Idh/MocA family oxidoreductase [Paenibacillus montanisoli]